MRDVAYCDFETEAIQERPAYPPKPVGVAIKAPGIKPQYLAWGHPTGNNTTEAKARGLLSKLWNDKKLDLCFYNARFDLDVGATHLGLPLPKIERVQDPGILGFFDDPRAIDHRLKSLAKKKLGIEPTERDLLKEWIFANIPEAKRKKSTWGAYISQAPAELVGRYAQSDITMTEQLHVAYRSIQAEMEWAYERERKLIYVLLEMEQNGVHVDVKALGRDVTKYHKVMLKLDDWIRDRIGAPDELNIDSDDLITYLESSGKVDPDGWILTPKGQKSTSADSLKQCMKDKELFGALQYRGTLATCLGTFMENWLELGHANGGKVFVKWNQFKDKGLGTKSGRLSSSPNFQNIPTDLETINEARPKWCPLLPVVRQYIIPPPGFVFIDRDFNSQEYRLFAHYEGGALMQAYVDEPWIDIHQFVTDLINEAAATTFKRKAGKTLNFGILYGQGVAKLMKALDVDEPTARYILGLYLTAFPGVKDLRMEMNRRDQGNIPIKTIGGRIYYPEPPRQIKGQWKRFGYKLVNLICQAGSADLTKQAMINYHEIRKNGSINLQVHDELLVATPIGTEKEEMKLLKTAMEDMNIPLDVPMLSEGSVGYTFADLKDLPRGQ